MVIPDLSASETRAPSDLNLATVRDRLLAGVFDLLLLVSIATFVPSYHLREARIDYIQGFDSGIWYQAALLWVLTYILVHTVFLYFLKTTPGGMIMHTRVQGQNGPLSWNQCLLRSTFSLSSFVFLGLPFLEVITHPKRRAWHDRISDTTVVDLKPTGQSRDLVFNVSGTRFVLVVGIFLVLMVLNAFMTGDDEFSLMSFDRDTENLDSIVAQALLKNNFSGTEASNESAATIEQTLIDIDERIWSTNKRTEKSLNYFLKLQVEKNEDIRKSLAEQICKWTPSEKVGSICTLAQYSVGDNPKTLQTFVKNLDSIQGLTPKVFLMKELTRNSSLNGALTIYQKIKKQTSLSAEFKQSLKVWDVALFWALRENQLRSNRMPASLMPTKEDAAAAMIEYVKERGLQ